MTSEEAVQIIKTGGWGYSENEVTEANMKAIVAIGFRTPVPVKRKEVKGTSLFGEALCPECGNIVYRTEDYCSKCGQALDWTEFQPEVE